MPALLIREKLPISYNVHPLVFGSDAPFASGASTHVGLLRWFGSPLAEVGGPRATATTMNSPLGRLWNSQKGDAYRDIRINKNFASRIGYKWMTKIPRWRRERPSGI